MSYPERNNPYSFDTFLEWRNQVDYYADDPFIQAVVKTYTGEEWPQLDTAARKISPSNFHAQGAAAYPAAVGNNEYGG